MAQQMKESQKTDRRKVLEALSGSAALGSAASFLPSTWIKPVLDTVLLPSHAQTSPLPELCTQDTVTVETPLPNTVIYGVNQYEYTVSSTGEAPLWYGFLQMPDTATIDSATGEIFWDPLLTYPQFPPGPSGTFEVQVIDANGCDGTAIWTVGIDVPG